MATVTLRELARNTASVIQALESSGRPALVTRNGKPVAALVPVDLTALEDWLLEHASSFTKAVAEADPDLASGRIRIAEWQQARETASRETDGDPDLRPEHLRGSHRGE
jgi:prevent-host-death family protein